jgi:hypothetical protein
MKRVVKTRLVLSMALASLMLVSAHTAVNASPAPINFMSTNGSAVMELPAPVGEYDFNLYNRTSGWVLNGFYTKEDGKWSKNWLSQKLAPGKMFRMQWNSSSDQGACVVPFKVTWDDYSGAENYSLDWCKGIKSVYLKDDTFTVDYK